jgi:hypothetical protein
MTIVCALATSTVAAGEFDPAVIAAHALPSVVTIRVKTPQGEASGSGFIVRSDGTIVTNVHVLRDATAVSVRLQNGDVFDQVQVRGFDERKDIAIIHVAGFGLPTVSLGDSETLKPGQRVVIIGNPLGMLEGSVSTGVVSGIRPMDGYKVVQTDATANPGNSGGPMLDDAGAVVGIVSFKLGQDRAENLNFAIPINYARGLLESSPSSMTLAEFSRALGTMPNLFGKEPSAGIPTVWKSLASGSRRSVRVDGDYLYVELVLTPEQRQAGDSMIIELKKSGGTYNGVGRMFWAGSYTRSGVQHIARCRFEDPVAITLFTPTRIEGTAPAWSAIDYGDCSRKGVHNEPFAWIPE